jgi:hypothetical protein
MGKPALGDRVTVEYAFKDGEYEGVVIELLSKQFTFLDDDDVVHYCFYNGEWRHTPDMPDEIMGVPKGEY